MIITTEDGIIMSIVDFGLDLYELLNLQITVGTHLLYILNSNTIA